MVDTEPDPYIVQPVLSDLYDSHDLLDFATSPGELPAAQELKAGPASPPQPHVGSGFFSSVSQIAAGVTGRTAGQTPPGPSSSRGATSPPAEHGSSSSIASGNVDTRTEVRCVEGFGNNLYVGGSDGVVEWWVYDGSAGTSEVSSGLNQGANDRTEGGSCALDAS